MKHERVTNEQAEAVKSCKNGRQDIYTDGVNIPSDFFAADLLDARAERDNAVAMVREMRDGLEAGLDALQDQGWTRHRDDEIALIEGLLEKSKEYEEDNGN